LRARRDFLAIQGNGRKVHAQHFLIFVQGGGSGRLGITVSKKVGNAVTRNRIRRLVREFVRRTDWVPPACDVVVVAKRSAIDVAGYEDVARDLSRARGRILPC
jgi:ribonuclease P protein component